jgi:hypothetical protein
MTDLEARAARERRYDLRTPIIRAIYDVMQAIEQCGASEKLTHAVTLAGALMEPTRVLLEERDALLAAAPSDRERRLHEARELLKRVQAWWRTEPMSLDDLQDDIDTYLAAPLPQEGE